MIMTAVSGPAGVSLVNEHGKDDHVEEMKRVAQVMMKYENVKDEGFPCAGWLPDHLKRAPHRLKEDSSATSSVMARSNLDSI